jgi:truncated hemoglobin YjbI
MTNADWILAVVDSFYDKAKTDVLIGYHFRNIKDFEEHIPRIASFWDLQLLGKTDRKIIHPFDIAKLHLELKIKKGEVGRWLILFRKTLDEMTAKYPEMKELETLWRERLVFFEGIFLRLFSVQNP